ncbi:hypothetical protein P7C70_g5077, partial [Phenoliferia sp. Uapishka_3]
MVNDPDTDHLIRWSDDGDSFYVISADKFGHDLLPKFFKHSNFGSFQRQLNMYGFHKVPHLHQGVLQTDPDESNELLEFSNNNFVREQPDLLCLIKRQKARTDGSTATETALDLPTIITDLVAIRKHQTALSADIKGLQSSNSTLWQEAIQSRDKQAKLQETVTKILRFLATVFGGQVVGQEDESPRENVVEEESGERTDREGAANGAGKGKGKANEVPRSTGAKRPRLLLKDVQGRENLSSNGTPTSELFDLDDEDIEEIRRPTEEDALPSGSGASQYATLPALARTNSSSGKPYGFPSPNKADASSANSSRFSTIPSSTTPTPSISTPTPTPPETQYHLPPDYLASLLSGGNSPATLEALFQLQNGAGLKTPVPPTSSTSSSAGPIPTFTSGTTPDFSGLNGYAPPNGQNDYFHRALLPSPKPSSAQPPPPPSTSNGFASNPLLEGLISPSALSTIFPASDALTTSYNQQLTEQTGQLEEMLSDKADIDQRTTALESAIAKLMQALPKETRDQLGAGGGAAGGNQGMGGMASGFDGANGTGDGQGWDPSQALSDADLENLLAQYVNTSNPEPSADKWDDPFEPGSALGVNPSGTFEPGSPSDSMRDSFSVSDAQSTTASSPADDVYEEGNSTSAKRGKKRKSEVMEAGSPAPSEGTRRSARKRK